MITGRHIKVDFGNSVSMIMLCVMIVNSIH